MSGQYNSVMDWLFNDKYAEKFNPHHGEDGKFASGAAGTANDLIRSSRSAHEAGVSHERNKMWAEMMRNAAQKARDYSKSTQISKVAQEHHKEIAKHYDELAKHHEDKAANALKEKEGWTNRLNKS